MAFSFIGKRFLSWPLTIQVYLPVKNSQPHHLLMCSLIFFAGKLWVIAIVVYLLDAIELIHGQSPSNESKKRRYKLISFYDDDNIKISNPSKSVIFFKIPQKSELFWLFYRIYE